MLTEFRTENWIIDLFKTLRRETMYLMAHFDLPVGYSEENWRTGWLKHNLIYQFILKPQIPAEKREF